MPHLVANLSATTLEIVNECRLFLQAVTLADICDLEGTSVSWNAYHGIRADQFLHAYEWPRQPPRLPPSYWDTWRQVLDTHFLQGGETRHLKQPLGKWRIDPSRHWKWYYDQDTLHDSSSIEFRFVGED